MSTKKKGLSEEEKQQKIAEYLSTLAQPVSSSDFGRIATATGINSMIFADLIKSTADADLIHQDKIGTSVFFWKFPDEDTSNALNARATAASRRDDAATSLAEVADTVDALEAARADTADRRRLLAELASKRAQLEQRKAELERFRSNDPVAFADRHAAVSFAVESANRWVDNCCSIASFVRKNAGITRKEAMQMCGFTLGMTEEIQPPKPLSS